MHKRGTRLSPVGGTLIIIVYIRDELQIKEGRMKKSWYDGNALKVKCIT